MNRRSVESANPVSAALPPGPAGQSPLIHSPVDDSLVSLLFRPVGCNKSMGMLVMSDSGTYLPATTGPTMTATKTTRRTKYKMA